MTCPTVVPFIPFDPFCPFYTSLLFDEVEFSDFRFFKMQFKFGKMEFSLLKFYLNVLLREILSSRLSLLRTTSNSLRTFLNISRPLCLSLGPIQLCGVFLHGTTTANVESLMKQNRNCCTEQTFLEVLAG